MKLLENFIFDLTKLVSDNEIDEAKLTEVEQLLGELIRDSTWFLEDKYKINAKHYARHSLYLDPKNRFEVLALVWQPGQKTPIHDHDGTWGVEGVLSGRIKVKNYLQIGQVSEKVVRLRHSGTMTINENSTGQLLPPADCHVLEAQGTQKAITIHIYGKQLCSFKIFEPLDKHEYYQVSEHHIK